MDLDKLSNGEKIAGLSAIVLFFFMFFDWFSVEVSGAGLGSASAGGSAWDALDWIPIFLVITIIGALGVAALRLTDSNYEPPVSGNAIVSILGGISFLLILYRIIDTPGEGGSAPGFSVDISPTFGIFVSLVAAAGIAYGAYKAMQEEGASFGEIGDRFGGGGGGGGGHTRHAQQPPAHQPPPAPPQAQPPAPHGEPPAPPSAQTPPPPPPPARG